MFVGKLGQNGIVAADIGLVTPVSVPARRDVLPAKGDHILSGRAGVHHQQRRKPRLGAGLMESQKLRNLGFGPCVVAVRVFFAPVGILGRIVLQLGQGILDRKVEQHGEVLLHGVRCGRPGLAGHDGLDVACLDPRHLILSRLLAQPVQLSANRGAANIRQVLVLRAAQVVLDQPCNGAIGRGRTGKPPRRTPLRGCVQ